MAVGTLEDYNGSISVVLFTEQFEKFGHLFKEERIVAAKGRIKVRDKRTDFQIFELSEPADAPEKETEEVHIELSGEDCSEDDLLNLRESLHHQQGPSFVFFHLDRNGRKYIIKANNQLTVSGKDSTMSIIKENPIVRDVWKE